MSDHEICPHYTAKVCKLMVRGGVPEGYDLCQIPCPLDMPVRRSTRLESLFVTVPVLTQKDAE